MKKQPDYNMQPCQLCGDEVPYGPHRYDLRKVNGYQLWVCPTCWGSNHDGWNPHWEAFLISHLSANKLPIPQRLPNGLLPRES